ncbi:MAG: hypothetical protein WD379_01360 [Dehalococcoidia bacterium]
MVVSTPVRVPPLRPYQCLPGHAIVDSAMNGRGLTFTVVMARQAGKNELSAQIELFLLAKNARRSLDGVKCAPTFEPQGRISLRRLWSRIQQAGLEPLAAREDGHVVRLGRARQLFLSAEPSASVVGHTASLLLEVDEAQDVDRDKFDREFRPMAASTNATTVYYGTPWDDTTLLERAAQSNLERERRDGVRRHFQFDWTVVAELSDEYRRYVQGERERLGESHPLFRTQYALKTVSGGRLFATGQRAQLQGTHQRQASAAPGEVYVAGLDVGGQDLDGDEARPSAAQSARPHDSTVLTVARVVAAALDAIVAEPRLEVVEHLSLTGVRHDELFARLVDVLGRVWRVRRVTVDATGLGETLARLLAKALGPAAVQPFRFTAESKSRLGYNLLSALNGGRLKVYAADGSPESAEFWREMELARVSYRANRTMSYFVDPSDGHDDYLMSLALTVEAARELDPAPRVARGRSGAAER